VKEVDLGQLPFGARDLSQGWGWEHDEVMVDDFDARAVGLVHNCTMANSIR